MSYDDSISTEIVDDFDCYTPCGMHRNYVYDCQDCRRANHCRESIEQAIFNLKDALKKLEDNLPAGAGQDVQLAIDDLAECNEPLQTLVETIRQRRQHDTRNHESGNGE